MFKCKLSGSTASKRVFHRKRWKSYATRAVELINEKKVSNWLRTFLLSWQTPRWQSGVHNFGVIERTFMGKWMHFIRQLIPVRFGQLSFSFHTASIMTFSTFRKHLRTTFLLAPQYWQSTRKLIDFIFLRRSKNSIFGMERMLIRWSVIRNEFNLLIIDLRWDIVQWNGIFQTYENLRVISEEINFKWNRNFDLIDVCGLFRKIFERTEWKVKHHNNSFTPLLGKL